MPYKISGTTQNTINLKIINESNYIMEYNATVSGGDYNINCLVSGTKTIIGTDVSTGKSITYTGINAVYETPPHYLEVGPGKAYVNLTNALSASIANDVILVYPNTYSAETIYPDKVVHIRGVGSVDSILFQGNTSVGGLTIQAGSFIGTMVIENIKFNYNGTNYTGGLKMLNNDASANYIINKCKGMSSSTNGNGMYFSNCYGNMKVIQSYIQRPGTQGNMNVDQTNTTDILKCTVDNMFSPYSSWWPRTVDVGSSTYGYGPTNGGFYIQVP